MNGSISNDRFVVIARPIFHKLDETIRGHVSCSFLALVLKKELEDRIATLGQANSWPDILADLNSLTETEVEQDGKCFCCERAASRRQPCPARRRRTSATNRPANRRRLIPPHPDSYRKCSAKPVFRDGFRRPVNMLQIRTVEDQSNSPPSKPGCGL